MRRENFTRVGAVALVLILTAPLLSYTASANWKERTEKIVIWIFDGNRAQPIVKTLPVKEVEEMNDRIRDVQSKDISLPSKMKMLGDLFEAHGIQIKQQVEYLCKKIEQYYEMRWKELKSIMRERYPFVLRLIESVIENTIDVSDEMKIKDIEKEMEKAKANQKQARKFCLNALCYVEGGGFGFILPPIVLISPIVLGTFEGYEISLAFISMVGLLGSQIVLNPNFILVGFVGIGYVNLRNAISSISGFSLIALARGSVYY